MAFELGFRRADLEREAEKLAMYWTAVDNVARRIGHGPVICDRATEYDGSFSAGDGRLAVRSEPGTQGQGERAGERRRT